MALEVIGTAKESSSWLGSLLDAYKGQSSEPIHTVDLPGYYPKGDGDGVHVGNDMSVVDRALRTLKEKGSA
jgi:hypothetical protein